jgi:DNA-binding XRE family transcriptional regulator
MLIYARDHKGHHLQLFGCIAPSILSALKRDYTIELEDTAYVDVTKTDWYAESQNRLRHGGLIRLLRGHKNISQGNLGKKLQVTGKYISDLENGRRPVSLKMAKKLAEFFNRKPERFLPV